MIHPVHARHDLQRVPWDERIAQPIAAFMGTGKFLLAQTSVIVVWVALNVTGVYWLHWDPYPFILLNLAFSTQAAYAAPLILLAQTKQAKLDRERADHDHESSEENLHLTRETHRLLQEMSKHRGLLRRGRV